MLNSKAKSQMYSVKVLHYIPLVNNYSVCVHIHGYIYNLRFWHFVGALI